MVNAHPHGVLCHLHGLRQTQALAEAPDAQLVEWFARRHEEEPFVALLGRHGPMVWAVARRVLANVQDAEDVFQATFLVLARKADSVRKAGSVGSWLHGVAHRLALKARLQQTRRRSRERRAADMRQPRRLGETPWSEVQAALDTALGELPEKYRAALVLCYLEGKTQEEAARQFGCLLATLRARVARGRKLLRDRLAKGGLTLSTAGLAALLIASAAPAAAPAALAKAAVRAAVPFAAGQPAATLCSRQAAGLVAGGLRAMFLGKVQTATAVLLAAGLVAGAAALAQRVTAANEGAKPAAKEAQPPAADARPQAADQDKDSLAYGGRVLGPDGRPVAGAKLFLIPLWAYIDRPAPSPVYATTGPDGRFRFKVPRAKLGNYRETALVVTADGHGTAWLDIDLRDKKDDLTLRFVKDDVPVAGQVVDLQGRPIQGVTVSVLQIKAAPGEDLRPWLEAVRNKQARNLSLEQKYISRQLMSPEVPGLPHQAVTDPEGRFRLTGIGRDRLVMVRVSGPTIATQDLRVLTRSGQPIEVPETTYLDGRPASVATYYGARFRHVAVPTKPIAGVVRDKDTKKPLPGITVQSYKMANNPIHGRDTLQTTTDAQGRYRLTGMPKGEGNKIVAVPGGDKPYPLSGKSVPDSPGLDPVTVDFELKLGVWIEGKVTDKATGKPLQARVEYFALYANPNLRDYAGFEGAFISRSVLNVKEDGSYRVVGLPGAGLLAVAYSDHYLLAHERDDEDGLKEGEFLATAPYVVSAISYNAFARIDPPRGAGAVKRDVALDAGRTYNGTVLGPDGKPLEGVRAYGLSGWAGWEETPRKTASFTVRAFNPRRPRPVLFLHGGKRLTGALEVPKDRAGPLTVRLAPGAAVTGRLVDADGRPRPDTEVELTFRNPRMSAWAHYVPDRIKTDSAGRFRVEALLPGYAFGLSDGKGWLHFGGALRPGRTTDLGDVRMKRAEE
jgi:RNA polymerase sigma factor (sigma-70 family)